MLSFTLPDEFVDGYSTVPVNWGYKDAGGNSIGEITYLRSYSRLKDDGHKERWHETCARVINGMYSIQKDWCKNNNLPWNENQGRHSAMECYDRMFNMKWLPPGRGIWMMGTEYVHQRGNSAALQNCFIAETKFLTGYGIQTLGDSVGQDMMVFTGDVDNGRCGWADATVQSFGVQQVQRITFAPHSRRSNVRVVETATPNHRWVLADGTITHDIKVGDVVPASASPEGYVEDEGLRHGLIFGDGSINYTYADGSHSHMMRLCGDKAKHVTLFENVHYQPNCDGDPVVYHRSQYNMKALPGPSNSDYIAAFISGWIATDGTPVGKSWSISTQDGDAVQWLKDNAADGGWIVTGHSTEKNMITNFGSRSGALHKVMLTRPDETAWTVKSIELLDDPVEVFCAVVPGVEKFTLASGLLTMNCAFVSTGDMDRYHPEKPFVFLMEASMLGIGVGFDTEGAGKGIQIQTPTGKPTYYLIPDSREGWVESVALLLRSYLVPKQTPYAFDYKDVRPDGAPIKGFGGTAAGPGPLITLHERLREQFNGRAGETLGVTDIVDICNHIGVCVVAGNVRRSAEIALGEPGDKEFLDLKNYGEMDEDGNVVPGREGPSYHRQGYGWMSNNTIRTTVGQEDYSRYTERIATNGEPGFLYMDLARSHGRLVDPPNNKDYRAKGVNPCGEQTLESYECCTLVETFPTNCDDLDDFKRTLKFAYLYAKTVTLVATHWPETNAVMQRNRRIGTSVSGMAQFVESRGWTEMRTWLNEGYDVVQGWDTMYSEWLGVRTSIKTTSIKPSGSVSLVAGVTPGVHWPTYGTYIRRIRLGKNDPLTLACIMANYNVEDCIGSEETTVVVEFPVRGLNVRTEKDVTVFEKAALGVLAQRYWADNQVSMTLTFDPVTESQHLPTILSMHEGQLKSVSFLPIKPDKQYKQLPYEAITEEQYDTYKNLERLDLELLYNGDGAVEAAGEAYCTTDKCEIKIA